MDITPVNIQAHLRVLGPPAPEIQRRPEIDPVAAGTEADESKSFGRLMAEQINKVNGQMAEADAAVADLAMGRSEDVHGTMIAMQKANLSFRMLIEVRNKAIRAYEELMRMQA